MTTSTRPNSFELADYLGVLRRRWRTVLLLACVGLLAAGIYELSAPGTYTAKTSVYVSALAVNNPVLGRTAGAVNMDNEAQIVQSQSVAKPAGRRLHSALSPQALLKQISVTVPPNTTVLNINCKASRASTASACANDFAAAYLSARLANTMNTVDRAITALKSTATSLTPQISALQHHLGVLPPNGESHSTAQLKLSAAEAQLSSVENQINGLLPELASLQAPNNTLAGYVISPAVPPASPNNDRADLLLSSGLLAGLLLGLLAAFLVDGLDDHVHDRREVERFLDLPVLLSLSSTADPNEGLTSPRSRADQGFTQLAQDAGASLDAGGQVLLVAGTCPSSSSSVIAANVAVALASTRSDTILICDDRRETVTAQVLGIGDAAGLAELLAGSATVGEVTRPANVVARLGVIPPGIDNSGAIFSLQHDVVGGVMSELRAKARYLVLDVQAAGEGAETSAIAEFADAAIVVINLGRTNRRDATDCLQRLDRMGVAVLGAAVVPKADMTSPESAPTYRVPLP